MLEQARGAVQERASERGLVLVLASVLEQAQERVSVLGQVWGSVQGPALGLGPGWALEQEQAQVPARSMAPQQRWHPLVWQRLHHHHRRHRSR